MRPSSARPAYTSYLEGQTEAQTRASVKAAIASPSSERPHSVLSASRMKREELEHDFSTAFHTSPAARAKTSLSASPKASRSVTTETPATASPQGGAGAGGASVRGAGGAGAGEGEGESRADKHARYTQLLMLVHGKNGDSWLNEKKKPSRM